MSTIRIPEVVPSPAQDCETLHKSCEGWGTDEAALIRILGCRNAAQRKLIRDAYQQIYYTSLIDCLSEELSGDFRKAMILWTYDPPERDARLANEALKSRRKNLTQLQVIVEIACATSPHHLVAVRQAYASLFDTSLEEDIISNVSLPLQKILVSLVRSYRYDKEVVDSSIAKTEAAKLREAVQAKKLDDDELLRILSTRNTFQLRKTFQLYKDNYGTSIDKDVIARGKGIVESVMQVVIWCLDTPEKHFAEVVKASIEGLGTDEDSLTRAIVGRAEIDMIKVREAYFNANRSSLDSAVIGDTSGYYKDFLMTLLGSKI
ncbi:annexin D3 [Salvia miltiorrhiza]|uniref:annexin D3 n=1 Tax=Salvia miltiorrhiza TaxID=226208 RepID=UPI0025ACDE06|nr:annexin D3 [Salvia miltiorrhiza]